MKHLKTLVIQNNLIKIKDFFHENDNVEINFLFETGWSCLMYACNNARVEIIKFLLEQGADPKICHDNYTCLMILVNSYAPDVECAECLRLLILAGAEVNYQDRLGKTAFLMSIEKNKIHCASTLLELNADPNIQTDENTALMIAVKKCNLEMVKLLLNMKESFSVNPADQENALKMAMKLNFMKIADLLSPNKLIVDNPIEKHKFDEVQIRNIRHNDIRTETISDFDVFLIANDIEYLKPTFQKYSIDGTSFTTLTEDDLIKMDIEEPNLINKLIQIISKINQNSSKMNKNINNAYSNYVSDRQEISCCECVDILKSTKEQISLALSYVCKLHDEYQYKNLLTAEMDIEHLKSLDFYLNESIQNVLTLEQDLAETQDQLFQIYGDKLPRLVKQNKTESKKSIFKFVTCTFAFTAFTASASLIIFYFMKR